MHYYTYLGFLNKHSILARNIITKYLLCDIHDSTGYCLLRLRSIIPLSNQDQQKLITKFFQNSISGDNKSIIGDYYCKLDNVFLFLDQQKTKWEYLSLVKYIDELYTNLEYKNINYSYSSPVVNVIAQVAKVPPKDNGKIIMLYDIDYIEVYGIYNAVSKL